MKYAIGEILFLRVVLGMNLHLSMSVRRFRQKALARLAMKHAIDKKTLVVLCSGALVS